MNHCFIAFTTTLATLAALTAAAPAEAADAPPALTAEALAPAPQFNTPTLPRVDSKGAPVPIRPDAVADAGAWQIVRRDAHSQTWESLATNRHPATGRVSAKPRRIVQLGSGLNYLDERGEWQPTRPEFVLQPDGTATARTGPFKVALPARLGSEGGLQFVMPDGTDVRMQVLGVGWFDPVSGKSALLGEVLDVPGELVASNRVVYRQAFRGLKASVQYTYARGGFSQFVILEEAPRPPGDWGLSDRSRLEVYSEIISASKAPALQTRVLREESDPVLRRAMAAPDLSDTTLSWGAARMIRGRAFPSEAAGRSGAAPVAKQLEVIDGRQILIEACELGRIRPFLDSLPRQEAKLPATAPMQMAQNRRIPIGRLHAANPPRPAVKAGPMRMSRLESTPQGLVIDYEIVYGATDFTFQGDITYWVTDPVYLYGTTRLEGGAVIKYLSSQCFLSQAYGQFLCLTEAFRPAIFTSMNDDSIGETIPGSTGTPVVSQDPDPLAGFYLDLVSLDQAANLKYLHFRYAHLGVAFDFTGVDNSLSHAQFVHCWFGVFGDSSEFHLRNVLFYDVATPIVGQGFTATAEHITVHQASQFASQLWYPPADVTVTNSLLVRVTSLGNATVTTSFTQSSTDDAVFQTIGSGAHYLAASSPYRNAGTTVIDPQLRDELRLKTTYPPAVIPQGYLTTDTTLNPFAPRDNDTAPDLGYHYEPIDHVLGAVMLQNNARLTLNPGTVIGTMVPSYGYYGIALWEGGVLEAAGDPLNPVRLVFCNQVHEQANAAWAFSGPAICYGWNEFTVRPSATLRFTECFIGQQEFLRFYYEDAVTLRDCRIRGGQFSAIPIGASQFINCWWDRTHAEVGLAGWTQPLSFRNCLFTGGAFDFFYCGPLLELRDNVFDRTVLVQDGDIANSHNAYVTGQPRLTPTSSTDQLLGALAFEPGVMGQHYLPAGSQLINAGSRSVTDAGLAHYTTLTAQTKDVLAVDIGLHYLALNGAGQPVDTDSDYVSDYLEDVNGNGLQDSGEFSHTTADTDNDGDGLTNAQEYQLGYSPVKSDTDGNGIPDNNEDLDGDLLSNYAELNGGYNSDPRVWNSKHPSVGDAFYFFGAPMGSPVNQAYIQVPPTFPQSGTMRWALINSPASHVWTAWITPDFNPGWKWTRWAIGNAPTTTEFLNLEPNPSSPSHYLIAGVSSRDGGLTLADDDRDGLDDGYETAILRTSPTNPDTDGDDFSDGPLMPDAMPLVAGNQAPSGNLWQGANDAFPRDAAAAVDTDGDGKPDDWLGSTSLLVLDDDDDNDGIPDLVEAPTGQPQVSDPKDPNSRPAPRWFVNVNAPAGGDGSKDLPFQTIQAAINAASASGCEIIQVAAGTYTESLRFNGKKVQVRSLKGTEDTIINGPAGDWAVVFNGDVTNGPETESTWLEGFTIRNGGWGGIALFNASRPVIVNCVIQNNGSSVPVGGGGIHCSASSPTIINCKILNNGNASTPGGGLYAFGASAPRLSHCTFSWNLRSANGGQIHSRDTAKVTNVNCIVWSTAADAEIATAGSGQVNVSYSTVRGGYTGLFNLSSDPVLETSGRLTVASPAKDRGTTNGIPGYAWLTRYDQDGEARLQEATPANILFNADIGSDEFVYRLPFPLAGNLSQVDEASGVAYLGTITVGNEQHAKIAVIDDELKDTLYIYELDATGSQIASALPVTITHPTRPITGGVTNNELNDLEGITFDDTMRFLYIITSQTKRNQYRNVDNISTDPLVDPPSSDYDRRRTILMRLELDANFIPIPTAVAPTRTVWESEDRAVPLNTDFDANNGLIAYIRSRLTSAPYIQINGGNNVLLAWNTQNKFGTPKNGVTYSAGTQLPYADGGAAATAGTVLGLTSTEISQGLKTFTGAAANTWYYFKIWAIDTIGNFSGGVVAATLTDGRPRLFINEFFAQGTGTDWVEVYNPARVSLDMGNIPGGFGQLRFRTALGTVLIPTPTSIGARGFFRFLKGSTAGPNELVLGTLFGVEGSGDNIYLEKATTPFTPVDDYRFTKGQDDDITEGRAWDGGPRGRNAAGICEGARFITGSPYPPTYIRSVGVPASNLATHKHLYATPHPDSTQIYLEWQGIGIIPAVWKHSPKQHDFHPINIEGLAYRSPTGMIIGLRSPLTATTPLFKGRQSGNALYFLVTNVAQFLPVGAWGVGATLPGITGPRQLNLNGQGIRSIEWCPPLGPGGVGRYLIIGGPANGGPLEKELVGEKFSLYAWDGAPGAGNVAVPQKLVDDLRPYTIRPEGIDLIQVGGQWRVMFVEDRFKATGYGTRNAVHWPVSILGTVL